MFIREKEELHMLFSILAVIFFALLLTVFEGLFFGALIYIVLKLTGVTVLFGFQVGFIFVFILGLITSIIIYYISRFK